ncbi:hypothetical protein LB503_013316 [Fusarium chuoi]|nr:hypothetical protein LB503_013316 [Fusarium chuoi]
MGQYGFLIPDRYVREVPGEVDMNTASIFWGFSLGVAVFSVAKASEQSWRAWKRRRRVTSYVAMIWAVWFSSMVLGCLAWGSKLCFGHFKSNSFSKSSSTDSVS